MIGRCQFCGERLSDDTRVDSRFCSDDHRTKYHNERRRINNLYKKALKAIDELDSIGQSKQLLSHEAKSNLRKLYLRLVTPED